MRVAEIEKIRDLVVGGVPPACRRHDDDAARGVCKHDLAHAGKPALSHSDEPPNFVTFS